MEVNSDSIPSFGNKCSRKWMFTTINGLAALTWIRIELKSRVWERGERKYKDKEEGESGERK